MRMVKTSQVIFQTKKLKLEETHSRYEERIPTRCNNSDVYCQLQLFIINYSLNMFRVSLRPSSGEKRPRITAYGVCAGGAGCGWLQLWGVAL